MIYALIDKNSGIVVNSLILSDASSYQFDSENYLLVENSAPIGCSYSNGEFDLNYGENQVSVEQQRKTEIQNLENKISMRMLREALIDPQIIDQRTGKTIIQTIESINSQIEALR